MVLVSKRQIVFGILGPPRSTFKSKENTDGNCKGSLYETQARIW
jgi:hypothetical protein